jgi:hypothetical protein
MSSIEISDGSTYFVIACGYEHRLKKHINKLNEIAEENEIDLLLIATYDKIIYDNEETSFLKTFLKENSSHGVCFRGEGGISQALYIGDLISKLKHCACFGFPFKITQFEDKGILVLEYDTESG